MPLLGFWAKGRGRELLVLSSKAVSKDGGMRPTGFPSPQSRNFNPLFTHWLCNVCVLSCCWGPREASVTAPNEPLRAYCV